MKRPLDALPLLTALALLASACASASPPPAAAPAPAAVTAPPAQAAPSAGRFSIEPGAAATRAAGSVELSGRELGSMWTFENAPIDYWMKQYGFQATQEWLEHVRLSSVRYGEYCSASFVSPDGLVVTNHHCARACVEANSTPASDYVVGRF